MCGRFSITKTPLELADVLHITGVPPMPPRYNVAPTQPVPVLRQRRDGQRELALLRWGLVPGFAQDLSIGNKQINARVETLRHKPSFREAIVRRRCAVIADGFYEWQRSGKQRLPYFLQRRDAVVMTMAGLWERWQGPDGVVVESCCIITRDAVGVVAPIHDRMPVILEPAQLEPWLSPVTSMPEVERLLATPPPELQAQRVSSKVSSPANDGPECRAPATGPEQLELLRR